MTFVSYAQNGEDVFLQRVFGGQGTGFYIDVGAYDPVIDSVTKALYDRGWSGINIEPGPIFETLAAARPRDINLRLALLDRDGEVSFLQDGRSAGLSRVVTSNHDRETVIKVPCDTLESIVEQYVGSRLIDFIKIDAEGAEDLIIRATNWRKVRPRILLVESTIPMSNVLKNQDWEPWLIDSGYRPVYFDGINTFYVTEEEEDFIRPHFKLPINVLDNSVLFTPVAQSEIEHWRGAAESFRSERDTAWSDLISVRKRLEEVTGECAAVVRERDAALDELDLAGSAHNEALNAERTKAMKEANALLAEREILRSERAESRSDLLEARTALALAIEARLRAEEELNAEQARSLSQGEKWLADREAMLVERYEKGEALITERKRVRDNWVGLDQARAAAAGHADQMSHQLRDAMRELQVERHTTQLALQDGIEVGADRHDLMRLVCKSAERAAERIRGAEASRVRRLRQARVSPRPIGHLDRLDNGTASGWAYSGAEGACSCIVQAVIDNVVIGATIASNFRQDLLDAGIGEGRHGFELSFGDHTLLHERSEPAELRIEIRIDPSPFPIAVLELPKGSIGTRLLVARPAQSEALVGLAPHSEGPPYPIAMTANDEEKGAPRLEASTLSREEFDRSTATLPPDARQVLVALERHRAIA